ERARLIRVCRASGLRDPELLADELHMLLEGARVTAQSVGRDGLGERLKRMCDALITAHAAKR
ncbi:MAG TPA: TetR/AcrR family transcriptional regulator, partial [Xanthobacteraceae bacterium]|nr:TetR/AcrR family transcriptional regulator [Xanthobacteraceae bacterium]